MDNSESKHKNIQIWGKHSRGRCVIAISFIKKPCITFRQKEVTKDFNYQNCVVSTGKVYVQTMKNIFED